MLSAALLAHLLTHAGLPAVPLTGAQAGVVTTERFGAARILRVRPERLLRVLDDGLLPVVAGFQGASPGGKVTTLGRGRSDTSAVALGAALGGRVELFKEVGGVLSADPRVVPAAGPIPRLPYEDAVQAGWLSARVLHPRAAEIARAHRLRLVVRQLGGAAGSGTELVDDPGAAVAAAGVPIADGAGVVVLTHTPDVVQFVVRWPADAAPDGALSVLDTLARHGINPEMVTSLPDVLTFVVAGDDAPSTEALLCGQCVAVCATPRCARVCVVGSGLRGVPGAVGRAVRALWTAGVEVLATADAATTVSVLVSRPALEASLGALHRAFCEAAARPCSEGQRGTTGAPRGTGGRRAG